MREVISLQTTIFLLVLIGYVVKRKKIIGPQGQKNLTDLVIYVILPCNILKAFMAGQAGKNLEYGTICSNAGFLGNPIAEGVFGAEGLVLASFFLIPQRIMMWSAGLAVFTGSTDRKATMKKVLTHPCIIACAVGLIFMLGKIHPFCLFFVKRGVLLKKYLNNHSITVVDFMLNNLCCKTCILVMFFIKV